MNPSLFERLRALEAQIIKSTQLPVPPFDVMSLQKPRWVSSNPFSDDSRDDFLRSVSEIPQTSTYPASALVLVQTCPLPAESRVRPLNQRRKNADADTVRKHTFYTYGPLTTAPSCPLNKSSRVLHHRKARKCRTVHNDRPSGEEQYGHPQLSL
ncbi:hypothetical protein BLNAU_7332 [Blattamonas nauphoetae]|uniref:Uncharacterized protein n=1 Tax=Blattamonas nauphoetae TaxID=2049346 RepID=A0ABQ9Y1R9_9EUKA|nr:hypothetical protein BLNAU_7332 [Blattamonas nauphoetae]